MVNNGGRFTSGRTVIAKIFISATTRELKSCRLVVAEWARADGHDVVVQDEFEIQPDYVTVVQMLRDKLAPCDAVIHLVGMYYGFEPANRPDGELRRSYTQLEYELGKELGRQVFRFIARDDHVPDQPIEQTDEEAGLQLQHRERLTAGNEPYSSGSRTTGNELYYEFSTREELRLLLDNVKIHITVHKPQNLPAVGELFKGRDEFLEHLGNALKNKPSHIAVVTAKQAIHGLGGVGKTRAAVEYGRRHRHQYTALLFISAESPEAFRSNLANLCGAMVLNLPEQTALEQEAQVAAALGWLRSNAGWFLIVDNVDTPEAAIAVEEELQRLNSGHIVVTSRLSNWGSGFESLELDVISEEAATEFLLERTQGKRRPKNTDADDAQALANDLDCLPLALEQAGAFISEDGCSITEYQTLWKQHDDEVITWHDQRAMKYPRSVAATWQTSFERLTEEGRTLLQIVCWLASAPIPLSMLEHIKAPGEVAGEAGEEGTFKIRTARQDLLRYSFLRWSDEERHSVEIHRLVQEITIYRMAADDRKGWLGSALRMVDDWIPAEPDCYDVRSWPTIYVPGHPHIGSVIAHAEEHEIPKPTARLMNNLAGYLYTRADFAEAEPLMRRALAIDEQSYGAEHPNVAIRLSNLAQLLKATNRVAWAEPLMARVVTIVEQSYGKLHPNVATAFNNLAGLLSDTNRLAEAEPLYRRALAIDEESYGPYHPSVATDLNNLALLLEDTNRRAEAEPLMRRALAIDEQSCGPDHPRTAAGLASLASLLRATNRLAEAEPLMRRSLAIDEQSYGAEHPKVALRLISLAGLLRATNRLTEAEPMFRRALAIYEESYGPDHPNVATGLNNLANLLRDTNRPAEAETLYLRSIAIDEESYGADHPSVAISLNNLADLFRGTSRLVEAEPLYRRAMEICEESYGPDHPRVASCIDGLADLLADTGRQAEAEPLYRRAVEIFTSSLGEDHPSTKAVKGNYELLLSEMEDNDGGS